jgi:hypothetical protein
MLDTKEAYVNENAVNMLALENMAEREGFEPSIQVLARITV